MIAVIVVLLLISTFVVAAILYRVMGRRELKAEQARDAAQAEVTRLHAVRDYLRLFLGPFPLSIAIHVLLLMFLLIALNEQSGRELITVNLEAGGGGGEGSQMQDLDVPEVPMPDTPVPAEQPVVPTSSQAIGLATNYVRAAGAGGIGIGRGGGIGSGYGRGIGAGFGGFIGELRRRGLDVVLVIDGTGSMKLIINDVKGRMTELIRAIHRLVPTARVGIVVYGGKGEPLSMQPFTLNPQKLIAFLEALQAKGGGEWRENLVGGVCYAIDDLHWQPSAKKVIVLVGDSPPFKKDFPRLFREIKKFRAEDGTFNTVDVSEEEHERFERELWIQIHGEEPPTISPLPAFYQQTRTAFRMLARTGGGAMRSLTEKVHINQQVLFLAFGEQWRSQVSAFGRGIATSNGN